MKAFFFVLWMGLLVLPANAGRDDARQRFDRDHNGRLDVRERAQLQSAGNAGPRASSAPARGACDLDHDGKVSAAERARAQQVQRLAAPATKAGSTHVDPRAEEARRLGSSQRIAALTHPQTNKPRR